MNVLIAPCLGFNTSLVERLALSVDFPVAHKVVVNNGKHGAMSGFLKRHPDWTVYEEGRNLGCAGAWNMAEKLFPKERSWLIANDDCWFAPGTLKALCDASEKNVVTLSCLDWSCFVWTREAIDACGTFDENIWPVYWEDTDMRMRLINAGITACKVGEPMSHYKPPGHLERYYPGMSACWNDNKDYFEAKWGSYEQAARDLKPFKTPFNKGGSIKEWTLDVEKRKRFEKLWKENTDL